MAETATARRTILPAASTPLEVVMDTTFPRRWDALAELVEPGSTGHNAQLLPWVAQQWQVTQFAPYFDTVADLMAEAVPWLMERGSAAAVRRALGWLGYTQVTIDEDGAWLHIDAGQMLTAAELARGGHVVRASIPEHVNFYRVFHGYDVRPIVLDRGPALDVGMLDGYSGVLGDSGVVESFGEVRAGTAPAACQGQPLTATTTVRVYVSRYDDMPVLDAWRLDSRVLSAVSGGVMELTTYISNAPPLAGGQFTTRGQPISVSAWIAPESITAKAEHAAAHLPMPMHPPRRWAGRWDGPWRAHFTTFITHFTEET